MPSTYGGYWYAVYKLMSTGVTPVTARCRGVDVSNHSSKWIQEGRDGVGHVGIAKVRKNESQCYFMMHGPPKKNLKFYVSLNRKIS